MVHKVSKAETSYKVSIMSDKIDKIIKEIYKYCAKNFGTIPNPIEKN